MARTSNKTKQKPTRSHAISRYLIGGIIALVLGAATGTVIYAQVYRNRILPGVAVGGVDLGGLRLEDARQRLANAVTAYQKNGFSLDIGGGVLTPSLAEAGITVDLEASLQRAYATGRPTPTSMLIALPVLAKSKDGTVVIRVDEAAFTSYLSDIEQKFSVEPIEPILRNTAGTATVFPGHPGRSVSFPPIGNDFVATLSGLEPMALRATVAPVQPTVALTTLEPFRERMAAMLKTPIALTFEGRRYPVTVDQLSDWLEINPNLATGDGEQALSITLNPERSDAFFSSIAETVRIEPKKVHGYESLAYGEYAYRNAEGRELDRAATAASLLAAAHESASTATVITTVTPPDIQAETVTAPRLTGKVISVDLTKQVAFAHEDGKLVFWTHVSTGKRGYQTPTGEWRVYAKTPRQVMDGPGYYLPNVKWVLPYNGDYTLHGTYWHANFGTPMSHGCTNLSENDAKWFYDWAEIGTPVIIYES